MISPRLSPAMAALLVVFTGLDVTAAVFALDSFSDPSLRAVGNTPEWHPPVLGNAAPPASKATNAYVETLSRPIFAKNRRPPILIKAAGGPVRPIKEPPTPSIDFTLAGVTISPLVTKAFIIGGSNPTGIWVNVGAQVAGWTVANIEPASLTLRNGDKTIQVQLYPDGRKSQPDPNPKLRRPDPE
jgi:hypothetical protein